MSDTERLRKALEQIVAEATHEIDGGEDTFADGYAVAKKESAKIASAALIQKDPNNGE